jgi:very-short-patch-repair endonuclease/predicted metal-dependent hydrolase
MSFKKYSNEYWVENIYPTYKVSSDIEILSDYKGSKEEISVRCKERKHEFVTTPNALWNNRGCPECRRIKIGNRTRINHDKWLKEVFINYPIYDKIELLSEYQGSKKEIKYRCRKCNSIHETIPNRLRLIKECPLCLNVRRANERIYENEVWLRDIASKYPNREDYEILTRYAGSKTKLEVKCIRCNRKREVTPNDLSRGRGCPLCSGSIGEKLVEKFLRANSIAYKTQMSYKDCVYKRRLSYDFLLTNMNILIEFDGIQHFKESFYGNGLKIQRTRDNIKNEYVKSDKNLKLLRISYREINNVYNILHKALYLDDKSSLMNYDVMTVNLLDEDIKGKSYNLTHID